MSIRIEKVYVAALFDRKGEAAAVAAVLRQRGFGVVSTWHDDSDTEAIPARAEAVALMDVCQVQNADALLVLAMPLGAMFNGGGHLFEVGLAVGLDLPVAVVGERSCIFYHLCPPIMNVFEDLGQALHFLETYHLGGEYAAAQED